jgi:hypothetical protein
MKLLRPPPYPLVLVAAAVAGVMAARWVADQEVAAARLAAERAAVPPEADTDDADTTEFAVPAVEDSPAGPVDEAEESPSDDWDADAEWEGELAYRVLSDQGAFDVEEIEIPVTEVEADAEPAPALEFAEVRVDRRSEDELVEQASAVPEERHGELAGLPRQALFEMAKELGVPMKDLIVMDREQLIEAIERAAPVSP